MGGPGRILDMKDAEYGIAAAIRIGVDLAQTLDIIDLLGSYFSHALLAAVFLDVIYDQDSACPRGFVLLVPFQTRASKPPLRQGFGSERIAGVAGRIKMVLYSLGRLLVIGAIWGKLDMFVVLGISRLGRVVALTPHAHGIRWLLRFEHSSHVLRCERTWTMATRASVYT